MQVLYRRLGSVTALLLLCVVLSACGTQVPDLKGKTVAQAESALTGTGFKLGKVSYDPSARAASGSVSAQDPSAGARASAGSIVNVVVAGAAPVVVPDLASMKVTEASATLKAVGLALGEIDGTFDEKAARDTVLRQQPGAGATVPPGSVVMVTVSKGPPTTVLPDVRNKDRDDAKRLLEQAGLVVQMAEQESEVRKGLVLSQAPAAATSVKRGSTITLTVSKGQQKVEVPDLVDAVQKWYYSSGADITDDDFQAKLDSFLRRKVSPLGLKARVTWAGSPDESPYQRPRAGTMVAKGTTVVVHLVGGE